MSVDLTAASAALWLEYRVKNPSKDKGLFYLSVQSEVFRLDVRRTGNECHGVYFHTSSNEFHSTEMQNRIYTNDGGSALTHQTSLGDAYKTCNI